MARMGMDVDQVEQVAAGLHTQAGQLQQAISTITNLVNQAVHVWEGQDSKQFADWWNSQHKPALTKAAEAIEGLSTSAKNNAAEQRQVSGH